MISYVNQSARTAFETFKSNVCHIVKDMGDIAFLIDALETDTIIALYEKQWYPECLYLLAMVDYISRVNNVPLSMRYNGLRQAKLSETLYPIGVILLSEAKKSDGPKSTSRAQAIPEFIRHNIIESEVRNVY